MARKKFPFEVGDKVTPNPDYPMNWNQEEVHIGEIYVVASIEESATSGKFVQLENVYSSYPPNAMTKVKVK